MRYSSRERANWLQEKPNARERVVARSKTTGRSNNRITKFLFNFRTCRRFQISSFFARSVTRRRAMTGENRDAMISNREIASRPV
jgi:hypothetical protein